MLEQIRCGFRLLFLALSFRAVPAHADCLSPSTALVSPFRQAELDLDLGLDYDAGSLAGAAGYLLENWGSAPATCANLLLNRLFNVTAVVDSAGRPLRFSQRVAVFDDDSSLQVLLLSVRLPRPVAGGRRIRLRVEYHGHLVGYTETGALYIRDRIDRDFTILREDAYAFPVPGTLSWQLNRKIPLVDFAFHARIQVPADLTVATGGDLLSAKRVGDRAVFEYRSRRPVPFLNVAIAPYLQLVHGPLHLSYFPQDSAGARRVADGVGRCLQLFAGWFGPLGEEPQLTVIEIPEGWGSQASLTGGIIQEADAFRDSNGMQAVYHELAHLWDPPDEDRPSARVNEGLASYLQRRAAASLDGWTGMDSVMDARAARLVERLGAEPRLQGIPLARYGQEGITTLSYNVGMLLFYALDRCVGRDAFNQRIGGFDSRYRDGGATLEKLRDELQSGDDRGVTALLDQWLFTTRWFARLRGGETIAQIADSCAAERR